MGEFPSGQRGQTVNLLLLASMVRIHPLPPLFFLRSRIICGFFIPLSDLAFFAGVFLFPEKKYISIKIYPVCSEIYDYCTA